MTTARNWRVRPCDSSPDYDSLHFPAPSPAGFVVLVEAAGNHLLVALPADTLGPPLDPELVIAHSLVCSSAAELTEPSPPSVVDAS